MISVALSGCGGSDAPAGDELSTPPPPQLPPPPPPPPPDRVEVTELRSTKPRAAMPAVSSDDAATLAHDNLAFSLDLYLELRKTHPGNFVFSQTSISTALGGVGGVTSVPPSLFVDRPLLFFIRHNPSGAVLFTGRVVDPSK